MKNTKRQWLYSKFWRPTIIYVLIISSISVGIVYYWSFYHFSNIFEDRIIDEYTLENLDDLGVKNEWILGVTTHSIDVLQATHGVNTRKKIQEDAQTQKEIRKMYREKVDNKHLLYMVTLDTEEGEYLYKYSVIKDIYAEIFMKILISFICFTLLILGVSYLYINYISQKLYANIEGLVEYVKKISKLNLKEQNLEIETKDENIKALANAIQKMQDELLEKDRLEQSTIQYISHEMKTPIMVIESYVTSALDDIYPKGNLPSTLETILKQTARMKDKVNLLLRYASLNAKELEFEDFDLSSLFEGLILNYQTLTEEFKNFEITIEPNILYYGDPEAIQVLIENLMENQMKYADNMIRLGLRKKKNKIILEFYNDGEKIEESLQERIFEPFVKGEKGNNGLGLSICKNIVQEHRGEIILTSTDEGTQFQIIL
ncbi:MAG: HAMP domain-containing sensor histidine kinase [Tissierellia bacterium]|nr:HAMP domain-containing sensor histidine kinase [Tissierellia bacterium]